MNWFECFLLIVGAMIVWKGLVELKDWFFNKYGIETKKMKRERENHEMILANAQAIKELAEIHKRDNELSDKHDEKIQEELSVFMGEVRSDIKRFTDNRANDRKQSLEIQKELTDSIKDLASSQSTRDEQISALMCGTKELLGNTIDVLYEKYINLGGVPQNEIDELDSVYEAYAGLNGNHGRQAKYEYIKKHLPIIPVKTVILNQ